jgi:hypothetical protein
MALDLVTLVGLVNGTVALLKHGRDVALGPKLVLELRPPQVGKTAGHANAEKYGTSSREARTEPAQRITSRSS